MRTLRVQKPARILMLPAMASLASSLMLSGCMSSAVTDLSPDPVMVKNDPNLVVSQTKANGESVPEVEIRKTAEFPNQITAASTAANVPLPTPEPGNPRDAGMIGANQDPVAASAGTGLLPVQNGMPVVNAMKGSIFATAPAKPQEIAAASKSGVSVPAYVPLPGMNPAQASIYGVSPDATVTAEAPGADALPSAVPLPTPAPAAGAAKGARVNPATRSLEVASVVTPQAQNPVPSFDSQRFSPSQAPANNPLLQQQAPAAQADQQPEDPDHPQAKLNAFFPPKPQASAPAASNGEEEDEEDTGDQPEGLMALISAPGLARVAPNGIWIQTPYVETDCFKPNLIDMLHRVEKHFGKPPVVTSGYRTDVYNKRAGGADHSFHTTCSAADIQVNGVSKWELASFLRNMPDRGGVGTYCYTNSVHVDTGNQRDWDWRCRRKKHKR